jgi:hypothetical protein
MGEEGLWVLGEVIVAVSEEAGVGVRVVAVSVGVVDGVSVAAVNVVVT